MLFHFKGDHVRKFAHKETSRAVFLLELEQAMLFIFIVDELLLKLNAWNFIDTCEAFISWLLGNKSLPYVFIHKRLDKVFSFFSKFFIKEEVSSLILLACRFTCRFKRVSLFVNNHERGHIWVHVLRFKHPSCIWILINHAKVAVENTTVVLYDSWKVECHHLDKHAVRAQKKQQWSFTISLLAQLPKPPEIRIELKYHIMGSFCKASVELIIEQWLCEQPSILLD